MDKDKVRPGSRTSSRRQYPDLDSKGARELYDQGMRDVELAHVLGVSRGDITKWRQSHGLAANRIAVWNEPKAMELYKAGATDRQIAYELSKAGGEVGTAAVTRWRRANDLQSNPPGRWSPDEIWVEITQEPTSVEPVWQETEKKRSAKASPTAAKTAARAGKQTAPKAEKNAAAKTGEKAEKKAATKTEKPPKAAEKPILTEVTTPPGAAKAEKEKRTAPEAEKRAAENTAPKAHKDAAAKPGSRTEQKAVTKAGKKSPAKAAEKPTLTEETMPAEAAKAAEKTEQKAAAKAGKKLVPKAAEKRNRAEETTPLKAADAEKEEQTAPKNDQVKSGEKRRHLVAMPSPTDQGPSDMPKPNGRPLRQKVRKRAALPLPGPFISPGDGMMGALGPTSGGMMNIPDEHFDEDDAVVMFATLLHLCRLDYDWTAMDIEEFLDAVLFAEELMGSIEEANMAPSAVVSPFPGGGHAQGPSKGPRPVKPRRK